MWLEPLEHLDAAGDPAKEIAAYIDRKLEMSRDNPKASRLFAMEIIQGAPILGSTLRGRLKTLVDEKAAVIATWVETGRLAPVDPHHLIFMIWATPSTMPTSTPRSAPSLAQGHPSRPLRHREDDAGAGVSGGAGKREGRAVGGTADGVFRRPAGRPTSRNTLAVLRNWRAYCRFRM